MRYFRVTTAALVLFFVSSIFGLSGCGEKQEPAKTSVVKQEAKAADTMTMAAQKVAEIPQTTAPAAEPSQAPITEERTFYDFEGDLLGWEVPSWAAGKTDHVAKEVVVSEEIASKGKSSMKVTADFPGGSWTAGLVEIQQFLDLSKYRVIRADVYLPADAPIGLKAKLILTVGENWKFVEMNGGVPLMPGEWATISASIEPGSYDWKRVIPDEEFAKDIRKIAIRVESNNKPKYDGVFYVDNVRVGR
ncbi:MAG: hypothetical protein PHT95_01520 [Candidatus Omnitrophica bacterium]|nr:hypothetical protein [Candidatus Omnitrophota bacterium]MDD4012949.1 hypothetical protein [Candidatus Omnitrophota bacterium]